MIKTPKQRRRLATKRVLDTAVVVAVSPVAALLAAGTAIAVRAKLGSPVLFKQERIGLNEKPFTILKFRSMLPEIDKNGNHVPNEERLTTFGRVLRKSSLDEIPQLWNILRGDMSLVGPRPLLPEYLPHYRDTERLRHSVRPGLTGLAQVSGRNAVAWDDRLGMDAKYAETGRLWDDILIVGRTVLQLVHRSGTVENPWQYGEYLSTHRLYPTDDQLALRRFEPKDIATRVAWFNDVRTSNTLKLGGPISEDGTRDWLRAARKNPLRRDYSIVDRQTGEVLALAGHKAENEDSLPVVYILVAPDKHGQGIGSRALKLLTKQMRDNLGLAGAQAEIFSTSQASQTIFHREGYREMKSQTLTNTDRITLAVKWS